MNFIFKKQSIPDVLSVETKVFNDNRGFFFEHYKESVFSENGINKQFPQENISFSKKNVIRGLHFQKKPHEQAKLVSVISGEIYDVAVDVRKNSPTFKKWVSQTLSEKNHNMLYVPEGFAHGFCVTSESAIVVYKTSNEYSPNHEAGILWNDPDLSIPWPTKSPIISEKDQSLPTLDKL